MAHSIVPHLIHKVLTDPGRHPRLTTTDVQQALAQLGHHVTRDTVAKHLRGNATRAGKNSHGEHYWRANDPLPN